MTNPMRDKAVEGLRAGDTFSLSRKFTEADTIQFGDLTRDYNPVHYDHRWANSKGFNGLICHGLLVGSMICEFGGQVGWLATAMSFRFIRPIYFDDVITCTVTITKLEKTGRAEAEAIFTNADGVQVSRAHMTGRLPVDADQQLLGQMVAEGDPTNKLR